jgi:hypothetical protein
VDLINPSPRAERVRLEAAFASDSTRAGLALLLPGGAQDVTLTPDGTVFQRTFALPPGRTRVALLTNIPESRKGYEYLVIQDFKLIYSDAYDLASEGASKVSAK